MARTFRASRWRPAIPDPSACWHIANALNLSPVTAQLLYNRGLTTPESAHAFFTAGRSQILDPFLLKDMDKAVALIHRRVKAGRPIMIYGDYDVDGVTGTTILVLALRALGAEVAYYIPDRFREGYGLNVSALEEIHRSGHDFVVSVDTGVTALAEAEAARRLGMTLVVSDHHEPGPLLPAADAVINPKRPDCTYPFKGLSGVGVAFKLALALEAPNAWELIDIVTLGTIADMVPLMGENRAIVREGLSALGTTRRPGLRALMDIAGVREPVTATHIGFALGPRINALGRMGSAMLGVELLITDDPVRASELARHLDAENRSRQEVEAAIVQEALEQAKQLPEHQREYVLVLAGEGWHHGVVGICASRVLEAYHRPAVMLSVDGDEVRGSARSIPAFDMHWALSQCSDLFIKFGGHAAAAGMTLRSRADIPVLRERLNRLAAQWLRPEDLVPELRVDARIDLADVSDGLLAELQALEPHGIGNPQPVFAAVDLTALNPGVMGKEQQHLRLTLRPGGGGLPVEAVGWNMAPARPADGARVQAAFVPELDTFQGRNRLRLKLHDLQMAAAGTGGVSPPNVADVPQLTPQDCTAWDPLEGREPPATDRLLPELALARVTDARDHRLPQVLRQLAAPLPEVAAALSGAEDLNGEAHAPEPSRRLYLETLAAPAGSRVLVLACSPWAAAALVCELQASLPAQRHEVILWRPGQTEPQAGRIVVAACGAAARGEYTDTVLYHPPLPGSPLPDTRLHWLWQPGDWDLALAALSWPYPDRDVLVQLYKALRAGRVQPSELARALREPPGPWNHLRLNAGMQIFREMGLVNSAAELLGGNGARFDLEASDRYRRGMAARAAMADLQRMIGLHGVTQYNEV